jgi:hypothetical protein
MDGDDSVFDISKQVRHRRQGFRERGVSYLSPRYDIADRQQFVNIREPAEIMFNFTGRLQQLEGKDSLFPPPPQWRSPKIRKSG